MKNEKRSLRQIVADMRSLMWAITDTDKETQGEGERLQAEIESCHDEMADKVDACLKLAISFEAQSIALKDRAMIYVAQQRRMVKKAEWLTNYVKACMEEMELKHMHTPEFPAITIKRNPPRLEIGDDAVLPPHFTRKVESVEILKAELKKALKEGEVVDGCKLVQGTRLEF